MKIENIDQLNVEIIKLEAKSIQLKAQLKQDYEEIKEELKPMNLFLDTVSNVSGFKINRDSILEKGFSFGLRFLLQQVFMMTEDGIEKKARILIDKASERISEFVKKIFNKKKKEAAPEEDGNYNGE